MEPLPVISFVIPVRNDAQRLQRCIDSIHRLDYPSDRLEIVVADNGSTDRSDNVAREAGAHLLSLPGLRVSQLRNEAVGAARGDIIAFVDADHEIVRQWATSAVDTLRRPGVAAVGAQYHAPRHGTWVQQQYDRLRRRPAGICDVVWLASGNMALWRRAFDSIGGFDARLHSCEDVDFSQRLRATGARVVSDARLGSTHFGDPATLRQLFLGELWRGRDNLRVSLRPPWTLRSIASLLVPVAELAFLCLGILGLATASSRGPSTVIVALAGLTALALLQSGRMLRSGGPGGALDLLQTFAVASVYGLARALGLVLPAPHQLRRQGTR